MFLATKHFDPVVGIDMHIVFVPTPAGPVPTPIPHPFVGVMFEPTDYIPILGAKVYINGFPRAHAGTAVMSIPHIPLGGTFAKPPGNEGKLFMGSSTVLADGEPLGYANLPVLSCQDIGQPAPTRKKGGAGTKSLFMPSSAVIAIPSGPAVLIGGAPIISMPSPDDPLGPLGGRIKSELAAKAKKVLAGQLQKRLKGTSQYLRQLADRAFKRVGIKKSETVRNAVHRQKSTCTGDPVDVATGKVITEAVDLELSGPLPFAIERVWYSTSIYQGPLGHGWHASFDMGLADDEQVVAVRLADGRVALFPALGIPGAAPAAGKPQRPSSFFNRDERLTLYRDNWRPRYRMVDAETGYTYHFAEHEARQDKPLVAIEDRNGFALQFRYGKRGKLDSIIDSGGRIWSLRHDAETGQLYEIEGPDRSDPHKRRVYVEYLRDHRGDLVEVRNAYGHAQRFSYQHHLLVKRTDRNGLSFHFEYDGKDETARCVRTWGDGSIYDHKLRYDPQFSLTTVENSLGHKTQYLHDGAVVKRAIDAFGNVRETEYGVGRAVLAEIDELGQRTSYEYDPRGNRTKTTRPDGSQVSLEYDSNDLPVRATDAIGGIWTWTRDARGRVFESRDPLGRTTRYLYEDSWLLAVVDAAKGRTELQYDRAGNLVLVKTPDGVITRYEYDLLGRTVATVDPNGNVQRRDLDALGRVQAVQEPDGNLRKFAYDPEGNVLRAKDNHHDVKFTYQGVNRLASRSEAGTTVAFHYDQEGQLTGVVNEHGHVYRFVLGPTGEIDEEHGFDGLVRKYKRDQAGRVIRVERPGERFSEYSYDAMGRVTAVNYSDGSSERHAYRADGALMAAQNDVVRVELERDALGRIVKETQGDHSVESVYDRLGMRVSLRSSLGLRQQIERNLMGDVSAVTVPGAADGANLFEAKFARDALGLELERTLPGVRSEWRRDRLGRPTQHVVTAGETTLRAVGYRWDVNDRLRVLIDGHHGPTEFTHDALGNLAWATYPSGRRELRTPDAVGNLFKREDQKDRKYGPAGQLLVQAAHEGEIRYDYDPEGNLIEKREPGGATWRYEWNGAGMLAKVIRPDGTEVTFAYDALGRRVKKEFRGQTTHWVWDGNVPLHEWVDGELVSLEEAGIVPFLAHGAEGTRREADLDALLAQGARERGTEQEPVTWLFEPESFAPLAKLVAGRAQSIVCDHLGTPVLMIDSDGSPLWSTGLSVYGTIRNLRGGRHLCPFRWPGQYEDAETGLRYNRHRYYDPEAGQYASQDPIGLLGGSAPHAYVADPLSWIDPLGLSGCPGEREGFIDPRKVFFTQSSVKRSFQNGTDINDAIEALRIGGADAAAKYPPIRVLEHQGRLYTLDNRRLLVFSQAGQDVPYRMATHNEIRREFAKKFSTDAARGGGRYISVRP